MPGLLLISDDELANLLSSASAGFQFPQTAGTSGQVLSSGGDGTSSWATPSGGGGAVTLPGTAGTAGQLLKSNGDGTTSWINAPSSSISYKTGSLTRNIATTGTQAITGLGFQPRLIIFSGGIDQSTKSSFGASCNSDFRTASNNGGTTGSFTTGSAFAALIMQDGSNYAQAAVTSKDSDGFTLTWSKTGSPTGTATLFYIALS